MMQRATLLALLLAAWALLLYRLDAIPPGFQHDQMFNTTDALEVLTGRLRLYYPANFGREPLGIYLGAAGLGMARGHVVWGLRFGTLLAGMAGLATAFSLARRYLSFWGSLLATGLLAGSFWFLFTARLGLEPMLIVPLAASTFYLMHRGLSRAAIRDLALAGAPAAASVYTYLAGRVLFMLAPILLVHELFAAWVIGRRHGTVAARPHWRNARGLALSFVVMLALTLPLLGFVRSNAAQADQRLGELGGPISATLQGDFSPVAGKAVEAVSALLWTGSTAIPYHYNIPSRPVMQPLVALLFLLGLALTVWRWLRPPPDVVRSGEFLLLAGLVLGMMPVVLTGADALHMRGVVALPLIFGIAARGAEAVSHFFAALLTRRSGGVPRQVQWLAAGLGVALVALQWITNGQAYFVHWAGAEPVQRIYNADFRAAAAYLSKSPSVEPVFLGTDRQLDLDQRTYRLYGPARRDARWFYLPDNPPVPKEGAARYLLPGDEELPPALALLAPHAATDENLPSSNGEYTLMRALRVEAGTVDALLAAHQAQPLERIPTYGDALRLTSAGIQDRGHYLDLLTEWETVGPWPFRPPAGEAPTPPKLAVSLFDEAGYRWAQTDVAASMPYRTWDPGDRLIEALTLPIPGDIPPGTYALRLAVYDDRGGTLAVRLEGEGTARDAGIGSFVLGPGAERGETPAAPYPIASEEAHALRPLGRWEPLDLLIAGVPTDVHIAWRAEGAPLDTRSLRFTLRATDASGNVLWQQEAEPQTPLLAQWPANQVYRLTHRLQPQMAQPGDVQAVLELCVQQDSRPVACPVVGKSRIVNVPPVMALPAAPQADSGATWSNGLTLAGYDLARNGDQLLATLYWRVDAAQPVTMKRFIHAVDAVNIVAQADATPDHRGLPMTAWRVGEYVTDTVTLDIPAGVAIAELRMGWYTPETGARIPVAGPDGVSLPDGYLPIPLE